MMPMTRVILGILTLFGSLTAGLAAQPAAAPPIIAFKAGRIHTLAGPVVKNGVVLVQGGKILTVNAGSTVPEGANLVADLPGAVVTPGFLDADAALGVESADENEQGSEVWPRFRVVTALDTRDPRFRRSLRAGITAVFVAPGSRGVIGGLGVVMKTTGRSLEDTLVKADAGLRVGLGSAPSRGNRSSKGTPTTSMFVRRPTTRMGVAWVLRYAFHRYRFRAGGDADALPAPDFAVMKRVAAGAIPLRFHARRATDIRTALRLAAEFDDLELKVVIDEATEAYKVAGSLARNRARAVLGPLYLRPRSRLEQREGYQAALDNAAVLHRAGVAFAFRTGGDPDPTALRTSAGMFVRAGLPWDAALRALTLDAARILGVDERVGSLEAGKDADLVVFDGDPLAPSTRILGVMIDGQFEHVNMKKQD